MAVKLLAYSDIASPVHRLNGVTKLLCFIIGSVTGMVIYDTRCLLALLAVSLTAFYLSKVPFKQYSFVLYLILIFSLLNQLAIFLFAPEQGTLIYGTRHELLHIAGHYSLTAEQLFYQFNVMLKYAVVVPLALLFLLTTDPSEFASSLNRIGVSYKIAYAISLTMRYIPDVQQEFVNISTAAQARGIDLSRKEKPGRRLKNAVSILFPLVLSTLERIEKVSAALELRGFGRGRRRTWYKTRPLTTTDAAVLTAAVLLSAAAFTVTFWDGSRFYNIFV
ncbi:energy-coupling factor transporter transmembrane component T [Saccharibacillus sp. CPCC 101409]|uniref:energy-coupling factor transporter transmembrane component T family protein n=1 Tax=Saccharibacillus sp. CPCC 101409 TaxID=3058041 RepID=UPI0026723385|nr:energy-coupling factor transporter transmembrane component T [Saccharibacillus sp. CPCC 101409]MDO3411981.1 energy-coupling factor transporter transmembrane component T [Saccharibacillus sp. CPCC 101409]